MLESDERKVPGWQVIDGLCDGDASAQQLWLSALRTAPALTPGSRSIEDLLSDWAVDACDTPEVCRFAARSAAIEKSRRIAGFLWAVASSCADETLTPVFERSAPSNAFVDHLWVLRLNGRPVTWTTRMSRMVADAVTVAPSAGSRGEVARAAKTLAAIDDPRAHAALFTAHAAAKTPSVRDAIATGFGLLEGNARASALFSAACANPAVADECRAVGFDVATRDAQRAPEQPSAAEVAAADWGKARQLRQGSLTVELSRTLERFETREALLAYARERELVPAGATLGPGDATLHDVMLRARRAIEPSARDPAAASRPPANDHLLRRMLTVLLGIHGAPVLQTEGLLTVWIDGEALEQRFPSSKQLDPRPAIKLANPILEQRGDPRRVVRLETGVAIGPEAALSTAEGDGLITIVP